MPATPNTEHQTPNGAAPVRKRRRHDLVFSVGAWVFAIALVPSMLGDQVPELSTSIVTGVVLAAYAATFADLRLWYGAASTAVTAICWFVLAAKAI